MISKKLQSVAEELKNKVRNGTDVDGLIDYALAKEEKLFGIAKQYMKDADAEFILPSREQIKTSALFKPVDTLTFDSYLNSIEAGLYNTWDSAIRTGYLTGQTTQQIVKNVMGSSSQIGKLVQTGSINSLRNSIYGNTRTLLQSFANETRNRVYDENEEYFGDVAPNGQFYRYEYLATLDNRTCLVCGSLGGKLYKHLEDAPSLPQHRGCRCVILPYFNTGGKVASKDGYTENISFNDWLEKQNEETQKDVLGATRYELFKSGKKVEQFVDNGKVIGLEELGRKITAKTPTQSTILINDTKEFLIKHGVNPIDYKRYDVIPSESELIEKLCVKDNKNKACTSLAFAFGANLYGYDVNDNRGGVSEKVFRQPDTIVNISKLKGVKAYEKQSSNQIKDTLHVLGKVKKEKPYILSAGNHTAVVRRNKNNLLEYLELQDKDKYGWFTLNDKNMKVLFNLKENIDKTKILTMPSILFDVESLIKSNEFLDLLRYLNTSGV